MKRNIIKIDEDKCDGCGACITDCPEGALRIINGKAKLVKESLCDGLGACIGKCPTGALKIEERDAEVFDEDEAARNMAALKHKGCPGMREMEFSPEAASGTTGPGGSVSELRQWPVQLKLLNPAAPYFKDADIVVAADCVPFSFPDFHARFLRGKILIVFCPKLDNAYEEYLEKLSAILAGNNVKSITAVHMEVPCCSGTVRLVEEAVKKSGENIIIKDYTVSLQGKIV